MLHSTSEILRATGLAAALFHQWVNRNHISLTTGRPGAGNHREHTFGDVVQVAVVAELSRLGVPPSRGRLIWLLHLRPWVELPGAIDPNACLLIGPSRAGSDHIVRPVSDLSDMGLDRADAPTAFIVFRWGELVRRLRENLAGTDVS